MGPPPVSVVTRGKEEMYSGIISAPPHSGELSLDEFIDGAQRDKWVMKMLQMDVNPGDWMDGRRRSANF